MKMRNSNIKVPTTITRTIIIVLSSEGFSVVVGLLGVNGAALELLLGVLGETGGTVSDVGLDVTIDSVDISVVGEDPATVIDNVTHIQTHTTANEKLHSLSFYILFCIAHLRIPCLRERRPPINIPFALCRSNTNRFQ